MRLISATVRAYRLHGETTVVFDPHRTLIGGPNEAGKSTFVEALHRALFFRAKGNTNDHRLMKSLLHQGMPEVELSFESGGGIHQLKKRFGATGDTRLIPPGGVALTGDAAEAELARLLGVESGATPKIALSQWAHLWVWQGQGLDDPTPHATIQRDSLLQHLQALGGAAAMQSAHDSRTAAAVAAAYDELFTGGGKVKANSALAAAESAALEAEAAGLAARARQEALTESSRSFLEATALLEQLARDSITLSAQLDHAVRQEALIRQRRVEEAAQRTAAEAAAARRALLEKQESQVLDVRRELAALEAELAPQDLATVTLSHQASESKDRAAAAVREYEAAGDAGVRARQQMDLAQAWLRQHEAGERLAVLLERSAEAGKHRQEAEKLIMELAGLPPVGNRELALLQKLDAAKHSAASALTAMAAGVEFLAGNAEVRLGGIRLEPGETRVITEETELVYGPDCRLLIRPGGGTSLAGAREQSQLAGRQCQAALDGYGVVSMDQATIAATRRTELESRLMAEKAALKSLQADGLPAVLAEAQAAHAAAQAETARRQASFPNDQSTLPISTVEAARAGLDDAARRLAETESATAQHKAGRDAAASLAAAHAQDLSKHQDTLRERHLRRTGLIAQIGMLLASHGDDATRASALQDARQIQESAAALLAATGVLLAELRPEHTTRNLERLQRSIAELQRQQTDAGTKRAVAAAQLRSDGTNDPAVALALAEARIEDTQETVQRLRRQAAARRLLHEAFTTEQAALAERFTQPLADRISGYLECLFGPGTRASVVLQDHAFSGLKIDRPGHAGGAFAFDSLSGGTREQTAAAVRLAMAEVLAADYGGTLPILFDDAFAYSDAGRLSQLQNMLDLAASRGLQVIILTHQPTNYTALGAKMVTLD